MANRLSEQEKEKKAQIILLERFSNSIYMLTDAQAGRMLKAIFHYRIEKQNPDFQGDTILAFFWQDLKNWLDDSEEHYRRVCETNRANIKARWDKKNDVTDNTTVYDRKQTNTNYTKANANAKPKANANANVKAYPNKGTVNIDSTNKGNGDFEIAVNIYQEKIGVLKSAKEMEQLKNLINNHSLDDVKSAIDFMADNNEQGVNRLEKHLVEYVNF